MSNPDNGIEFTDDGVQVQVNDEWLPATVITEQDGLLFVAVDLPDGVSLQTWKVDGDDYVVIDTGIVDIEVPQGVENDGVPLEGQDNVQ